MSDETGTVLYVGPVQNNEVMVITEDRHEECGWPERISYMNSEGLIVRSGCAGCEADRGIE